MVTIDTDYLIVGAGSRRPRPPTTTTKVGSDAEREALLAELRAATGIGGRGPTTRQRRH